MDYKALVHAVIDPFVSNPDAILVRELPNEGTKDITILICTANEDIARLIGKKGCVANAIRNVIGIAGKLEEKRIHIKFESFEEKSEN